MPKDAHLPMNGGMGPWSRVDLSIGWIERAGMHHLSSGSSLYAGWIEQTQLTGGARFVKQPQRGRWPGRALPAGARVTGDCVKTSLRTPQLTDLRVNPSAGHHQHVAPYTPLLKAKSVCAEAPLC